MRLFISLLLFPFLCFGQSGKRITSNKLSDLDSSLASAFRKAQIKWSKEHPDLPKPYPFCTYRSPSEQLYLYSLGRTRKGSIVTNLKSGSKHNVYPAKAIDIVFVDKYGKERWDREKELHFLFAPLMETQGITWNGKKKLSNGSLDTPHYEIK